MKNLAISIATYKQTETGQLPALIYSLVSQSSQDFHAYVAHDGPDQATREFMATIISKYPNFSYTESTERKNLWGHNLRQAQLEITQEPYITFTNGDNLYFKDYVAAVNNALKKGPGGNPTHFDVLTVGCIHNYFGYQVFSGHEFQIAKSDFMNYVLKTSLARQLKIKETEFAADGHLIVDFRTKFPNFKQVRVDAILGVHQ